MHRIDASRFRGLSRTFVAMLGFFGAACAAAGTPGLVLTLDDDLDYARYGQVIDYRVTLVNEGAVDATGLAWSMLVSSALDGEAATWTCYGAGAGATCGGNGEGLPTEGGIDLPAGRSLTWVVAVPVRADTADASAEALAVLADPEIEAIDSNRLVLLRDGFDVGYPPGAPAD
ncbi:MAG TPA: hypothetical protein VF422_11200 [Dokdonella sp.]